MSPTAMPDMPDMAMPGSDPGSSAFLVLAAMWIAMMIGMMTPSVAPMLLIYLRVAHHAQAAGRPLASVAWFAAGYGSAWTGFSLLAALLQTSLTAAGLLSPAMAIASRTAGAVILIAAGLWQWTPMKDACLTQCRAPLAFVQAHGGFQPTRFGSWRLGLQHGLFCIGCCWLLMTLLLVVGVMSLVWIAGLMVLALLEKIVPRGRLLSRGMGVVLVAAGAWMLLPR